MSSPPVTSPPVLLVHGFGGSADRTWRDNGWLDLLSDDGHRTIAPDLLGHGGAPRPRDPGAYNNLESRVWDSLPKDGPVDAIGFSLGARVVLTMAADQPQHFRRIVVAGAGANLFRDEPSHELAAALRSDTPHEHPLARYSQQLAAADHTDGHALAALLERTDTPPLGRPELARITAPVLVLIGSDDFAGPGDPLADALPDATLLVIPGLDHFATPKNFAVIDHTLAFLR